jgi:maltooligosyltrehalose synthase
MPLPASDFWADTVLSLPEAFAHHSWRDALAINPMAQGSAFARADLFARFAVAVLVSG